jgi:hypothetical protein
MVMLPGRHDGSAGERYGRAFEKPTVVTANALGAPASAAATPPAEEPTEPTNPNPPAEPTPPSQEPQRTVEQAHATVAEIAKQLPFPPASKKAAAKKKPKKVTCTQKARRLKSRSARQRAVQRCAAASRRARRAR